MGAKLNVIGYKAVKEREITCGVHEGAHTGSKPAFGQYRIQTCMYTII